MPSRWTLTGPVMNSWSPASGLGKSPVSVQTRGWMDWKQPHSEELGKTSGWKTGNEPAMCTHCPESKPYPGLHQKKSGQQVERGDPFFLLCSGETLPRALFPALGTLAQEWQRPFGADPGKGHKSDQKNGTLRELWLFNLEKRRLQEGLTVAFQNRKSAYERDGERLFSKACGDSTRDDGFRMKEGRFRLGISKKWWR